VGEGGGAVVGGADVAVAGGTVVAGMGEAVGVAVGDGWGVAVFVAERGSSAFAWLSVVEDHATTDTAVRPIPVSPGSVNTATKRPSAMTAADAKGERIPAESSRPTKIVSPGFQPSPVTVTGMPGVPASETMLMEGVAWVGTAVGSRPRPSVMMKVPTMHSARIMREITSNIMITGLYCVILETSFIVLTSCWI